MNKEDYVKSLEVLYEDNHIIVVVKPINILSQKDITNDIDMNEIVKVYLKEKYKKTGNVYLGLVHRLDRRVGGVMVFAKTSKAAKRLSEDIRNHNFLKIYIVKTLGIINSNGDINIKIAKDEKMNIAKVSPDGKDARLSYELINSYDKFSYAYVKLETGRYNQIRVSFSHIGCPIVNDYKYSNQEKTKEDLGLWCYRLGFNHPVLKKYMEFSKTPTGGIWKGLENKKK